MIFYHRVSLSFYRGILSTLCFKLVTRALALRPLFSLYLTSLDLKEVPGRVLPLKIIPVRRPGLPLLNHCPAWFSGFKTFSYRDAAHLLETR
jgi:hypothetical protein